jgi:hypothetical protein
VIQLARFVSLQTHTVPHTHVKSQGCVCVCVCLYRNSLCVEQGERKKNSIVPRVNVPTVSSIRLEGWEARCSVRSPRFAHAEFQDLLWCGQRPRASPLVLTTPCQSNPSTSQSRACAPLWRHARLPDRIRRGANRWLVGPNPAGERLAVRIVP